MAVTVGSLGSSRQPDLQHVGKLVPAFDGGNYLTALKMSDASGDRCDLPPGTHLRCDGVFQQPAMLLIPVVECLW